MKTVSPTKLRQHVYQILDQVVMTGEPVTIQRKGVLLRIVPPRKKGIVSKRNRVRTPSLGPIGSKALGLISHPSRNNIYDAL